MAKKKTDSTKTILVITFGFMFLYLIWQWEWALYIALAVSLMGIISPWLSKKIAFLWDKLSWVLSLIIPNILLSIVFYFILFPISLVSKLMGAKSQIVLKNKSNSFFIESNKEFNKSSFEKPW